ncbi:hypothetical protein AB0M54_45795 [Actinoplanes sp. NPDC051470]|uniref:hypothetical protein n=1 Tax=Actinoplanes sp. NPDC051470 TaxID=3157224 RepID=UPI0034422AB1
MAKIGKSPEPTYALDLNHTELEALYASISLDRNRFDSSEQADTASNLDDLISDFIDSL